jgi:N-terminal domain of Peptidase_S41 in eukaryotic IRBP/Peptidase family S41
VIVVSWCSFQDAFWPCVDPDGEPIDNTEVRCLHIGLACLALLAVGSTQANLPPTGWNDAAIKATIEQVAVIVHREYMDGDVAARAAEDLRRRLALSEYPATLTAEELATRLTRDLFAITNDKHIAVSLVPPTGPAGSTKPDSSRSREESVRRTNGGVQGVEVLAGNVGYLKLTSFWRIDEGRGPITAAMQLLRGADALILDMRSNTGGSPDTAALILSIFSTNQESSSFR